MSTHMEDAVKRILGLPSYLDQDLSIYFQEDSPQSIARAMLITGLMLSERLGTVIEKLDRLAQEMRDQDSTLDGITNRLSDLVEAWQRT